MYLSCAKSFQKKLKIHRKFAFWESLRCWKYTLLNVFLIISDMKNMKTLLNLTVRIVYDLT